MSNKKCKTIHDENMPELMNDGTNDLSTVYKTNEEIAVEYENAIFELSSKEVKYYNSKESYAALSDTLLEQAKKDKDDGKGDIIKDMYGGNNDKTRKRYVKEELVDEAKEIKDLEFSIDYLKRRISFLKAILYLKMEEK